MALRGDLRPTLTDREQEALRLRAEGLGAREAAAEMHVSRNTFYVHIKNAYRRLDVSSLVDALRGIGWLRIPPRDR